MWNITDIQNPLGQRMFSVYEWIEASNTEEKEATNQSTIEESTDLANGCP